MISYKQNERPVEEETPIVCLFCGSFRTWASCLSDFEIHLCIKHPLLFAGLTQEKGHRAGLQYAVSWGKKIGSTLEAWR